MFETLTDEQILLFFLALIGLIVFAIVALRIGRTPKSSKEDPHQTRKKVEEFERMAQDPDPPGDSPFIKLIARVDAVEKELPNLKREIENIRNFAKLLGSQKEKGEQCLSPTS